MSNAPQLFADFLNAMAPLGGGKPQEPSSYRGMGGSAPHPAAAQRAATDEFQLRPEFQGAGGQFGGELDSLMKADKVEHGIDMSALRSPQGGFMTELGREEGVKEGDATLADLQKTQFMQQLAGAEHPNTPVPGVAQDTRGRRYEFKMLPSAATYSPQSYRTHQPDDAYREER